MRSRDLFEQVPPERALPAESKQRLKEELMSTIKAQSATVPPRRRTRRYRRGAVLSAAMLAVAGVGTAWALTTLEPGETTRIQCPGDSIIAAVSGDPVTDCANAMREEGIEPPAMTAYVSGTGGVIVAAEGDEIESDWEALPTSFEQSKQIIEFEAAIGDVTIGLEGGCYTNDEAVAIISRELLRFGLDWSVETRDDPDGVDSCAAAFIEPEHEVVKVVAIDGVDRTGDEPWVVFGAQLHDALDAGCLHLDGAADLVSVLATAAGIDPSGMRVTTTIDNAASCSRATVTVGGLIFVDLRGPQS